MVLRHLFKPTVTATVADHALVVRVGGDTPKLWRGSLSDVAAATLEVQESREGNAVVHRLLLIRSGGGTEEIARFKNKAEAQHAFDVVSDRLLQGVEHKERASRPFLLRVLFLLIKVALWVLFAGMILIIVAQLMLGGRGTPTAVTDGAPPTTVPAAPAGVPVPADQLFQD